MRNHAISELLGIILGDGCLSRSGNKHILYICGHKQDDLPFYKTVVLPLIQYVLNKETKINFKKGEQTLFVRFSDKATFDYLSNLGIPIGKKYETLRIPRIVEENQLMPNFLRGLLATDGCVILSKQHRKVPYYPRIEISSKSKTFLDNILVHLQDMDFNGSVSNKGKCCFRLEIPGFENLFRWYQLIGFLNIKHYLKIQKLLPKSI
jgi:intein/homing endonuclease